MEGKTKVIMVHTDQQYNEFQKGETGYVDGYVRGGNNVPCVVVVIGDRIIMASIQSVKVIQPDNSFVKL